MRLRPAALGLRESPKRVDSGVQGPLSDTTPSESARPRRPNPLASGLPVHWNSQSLKVSPGEPNVRAGIFWTQRDGLLEHLARHCLGFLRRLASYPVYTLQDLMYPTDRPRKSPMSSSFAEQETGREKLCAARLILRSPATDVVPVVPKVAAGLEGLQSRRGIGLT